MYGEHGIADGKRLILAQFKQDLDPVPKTKALGIVKTKYNIKVEGICLVGALDDQFVFICSVSVCLQMYGGYNH